MQFKQETGPVFPTSTVVYHELTSNTVIKFLAVTLSTASLAPSGTPQLMQILNVFPVQVVNSGEMDVPIGSHDRSVPKCGFCLPQPQEGNSPLLRAAPLLQ